MNVLNPEPGLFIWEAVIFLLFVFILKKLAWAPLLESLKHRGGRIADSLASVEKIRSEVEQWENEREEIRRELTKEISYMHKAAQEYRDTLLIEAREKAKEEFDKAIKDARLYCQKLQKEAINDIKARTGQQVVRLAENILREELCNPNEQQDFLLSRIREINFQVMPHRLGKVA